MKDLVCGVDEAGRGPWAGPVAAAAVILDPAAPILGLADSKALTAKRRTVLAAQIRAGSLWGLGFASPEEIDALNIRLATHLAMRRAVAALPRRPTLVLVDGVDAPELGAPARAIVKGDASEPAISAASILAKTARDAWMMEAAQRFPGYGFERHMGYGAPEHAAALTRLGPTPIHRLSFKPVAAARARLASAP
jgi:ribonuclease HII